MVSKKSDFFKRTLKNGMTVLFEKRDLPVVSLSFAVKAGAVNEKLEEKGISHFIEHMLYKGTPKRKTQDIAEEIERVGGDLNGFTSQEIVAFWCKMPSEKISIGLEVLSDLIKNPLFDEKEFEKERKVIFEEIKMYKDNPRLHVFDKISENLYEGTLGKHIAGDFETMNSITRDFMVDKFKKWFQPKNLILCVVGNANFEKLCGFVEKNFSYGNSDEEIPEQEIKKINKTETEKRTGIDQANMVFAFHLNSEEEYAARILNSFMAEGLSSRLFSEIREKRNLAYSVKGEVDVGKRYAYSMVYVGTKKESIEEIKKIILKEYKKFSKEFNEKQLQEIKEQLIGNYKISMEDSRDQMINLLGSEIKNKAEDFYEFEKEISKVKLENVIKISKRAYEKFSFYALIPED
ncbi:MAG: M16 family metallopeptidase [Nanoarchaeota archaeon]